MYAIVEVGGKQYKVSEGDIIDVEKQDVEAGKVLALKNVLLAAKDEDIKVGQPYVSGAVVNALVSKQIKADKVVSFKYRRRKSSHWKKGHRQQLTRLKIKEIIIK
jgi:large subunit ribosomal protein L21